MVSNIYLNEMAENLKYFRGTFSCNNIPIVKDNTHHHSYIVNLSKKNDVGSHFIALCITQTKFQKTCMYFDSFGVSCDNKYILKYMSNISDNYKYNAFQIQDFSSLYCGFFALGCVMSYENNCIFKYINMFNENNLLMNDKNVIKYIVDNKKLFYK